MKISIKKIRKYFSVVNITAIFAVLAVVVQSCQWTLEQLDKAKPEFVYRKVFNTPYGVRGREKLINYQFELTNVGKSQPMVVRELVAKFTNPIKTFDYVQSDACTFKCNKNLNGLTFISESAGLPAGESFYFSIAVDEKNVLERAYLIPALGERKDAINSWENIEYEKDPRCLMDVRKKI